MSDVGGEVLHAVRKPGKLLLPCTTDQEGRHECLRKRDHAQGDQDGGSVGGRIPHLPHRHDGVEDLQGAGPSSEIALASFVSLVSSSLKKQIKEGLVILGNLTIGGTISKVDDLADTLEVCFDAGARTILLPMSSATDISTVPAETFSKFNISFYNDPEDAARKALDIAG